MAWCNAQKTNADKQILQIVILWLGGELYPILLWLQRHQNYLYASQCRISHLLAPLEQSKLKAKVPLLEETGLTTKEWKCLE